MNNRAPPLVSTREKPLLVVEVNLGSDFGLVPMGVYKDDTASTVADRVLREAGARFANASEQRLKTRQLAQVLET